MEKLKIIEEMLIEEFNNSSDKVNFLNSFREFLHFKLAKTDINPVGLVKWVPIEKVCPNDYNPNSVAQKEMQLLYISIKNDGYTQPVVTFYDKKKQKYIIVDGFHRYFTCKSNKDIYDKNNGLLPIVVIEKDINDRMASTVRHNRARGSHSITGMSNMVFEMLNNGAKDADICNRLGLEKEELIRYKHITGFSKLFAKQNYNNSWETEKQLKYKKDYLNKTKGQIL
jgi:ParB-like chromosome segregation protein Spo0J